MLLNPLAKLLQNRATIADVAQAFWSGSPAQTADGQVLQDTCMEHGITCLNIGTKGSTWRVSKHSNLHKWLIWDSLQSLRQSPRHNLHYCHAIQGWLYRTVVYDIGQLSEDAYQESDLGAFCTFQTIRQTSNTYTSFAQAAYWTSHPVFEVTTQATPVSTSPEYRAAERRAQIYRVLHSKKLLPDIP